MPYTIKAASKRFGLTEYTLRYYEKEGLIPSIARDKNGNRRFTESDLEWIQLICCLRNTGMPISRIKQYIGLCGQGTSSAGQRREILVEHQQDILRQISQLETYMRKISNKIEHYDAVTKGKADDTCNPFSHVQAG